METRIDWRQVWNDNLDTHRRKLPGSPADQNNVEVQLNINEVVKQSKQCCDRRTSSRTYAVGHPQRRIIQCYDQYHKFQQIPFCAGLGHLFCFVYALLILSFYKLEDRIMIPRHNLIVVSP